MLACMVCTAHDLRACTCQHLARQGQILHRLLLLCPAALRDLRNTSCGCRWRSYSSEQCAPSQHWCSSAAIMLPGLMLFTSCTPVWKHFGCCEGSAMMQWLASSSWIRKTSFQPLLDYWACAAECRIGECMSQVESAFSACRYRAEAPCGPQLRACCAALQTTRIRGCLSGGMLFFNSGRAAYLTSPESWSTERLLS